MFIILNSLNHCISHIHCISFTKGYWKKWVHIQAFLNSITRLGSCYLFNKLKQQFGRKIKKADKQLILVLKRDFLFLHWWGKFQKYKCASVSYFAFIKLTVTIPILLMGNWYSEHAHKPGLEPRIPIFLKRVQIIITSIQVFLLVVWQEEKNNIKRCNQAEWHGCLRPTSIVYVRAHTSTHLCYIFTPRNIKKSPL